MRQSFLNIFCLFLLCFSFSSCQRKVNLNNYYLIENDRFLSETRYALIRPEFLRLRETPDLSSIGVATLYHHDMVQVVLMVNQSGGWCRLLGDKMQGWLPVEELIFFESYQEAKKYQNGYRNATAKN